MNRYLIYDVGYGEQGMETRWAYYRYYICSGNTEEEAVKDWIRQSPFDEEDIKKVNGEYTTERSTLVILKLKDCSNKRDFSILKWE